MKAGNESNLVAAVLRLLSLRGVYAWRCNTAGIWRASIGRYTFRGTRGVSDVMACLAPSGRLLAVECKTKYGKQDAYQKAFQSCVEQAGGVYLVVRDVLELDEWLSEHELKWHEV